MSEPAVEQPDLGEFATIGAQIAEIGTNLNQLRAQRAELDQKIHAHETELGPLIVRHSELIAALTGQAMPQPRAVPASQYMGVGRADNLGPQHPAGPPVSLLVDGETARAPSEDDSEMPQTFAPVSVSTSVKGTSQQKERIKDFLVKCEEGVTSHQVADKLKVDSALVRAVMREMMNPR
jgi:hypothetical protein